MGAPGRSTAGAVEASGGDLEGGEGRGVESEEGPFPVVDFSFITGG